MILGESKQTLLKERPSEEFISEGLTLQTDHKVHVNGDGYENIIQHITGYEDLEKHEQKKLITKPLTKLICRKILFEHSRWQNSQGTVKRYDFGSEDKSTKFEKEVLSKVWKGESINKFIKEFLFKAIYTEFNGFLIVERGQVIQEEGKRFEMVEGYKRELKEGQNPTPYIIFKSLDTVVDFKARGNRVEYLIYLLKTDTDKDGKETKYYRVLDDQGDFVYYTEDNENFKQDLENYPDMIWEDINHAPVVRISTLNKEITQDHVKTSYIDELIPILDLYLNQFANHAATCILHSHPILYTMEQKCRHEHKGSKCDAGYITYQEDGKSHEITCPSCKGEGRKLKFDASTVMITPSKDVDGNPIALNAPAGYVTPPTEVMQQQVDELEFLEQKIISAALGREEKVQTDLKKTATEAIMNSKPLEDIISMVLQNIEYVETFLTNTIAKFWDPTNFKGSYISYGKRLVLKNENVILDEIKEAKESGANQGFIYELLCELITAKYQRYPKELSRQKALLALEPLPHLSLKACQDLEIVQATFEFKKQFFDLVADWEGENGRIEDYKQATNNRKVLAEIKKDLQSKVVINDSENGKTEESSESGGN